MRCNFVLPYAGPKGGIRILAIYAQKLQQRGHQVFVLSQPKRMPTLTQKVKTFARQGHWPHLSQQQHDFFGNIDVEHRVLDQVRDVTDGDLPDADVVIATWWQTAQPVYRLSARKGAKVYLIQDYGAPGQRLPDLIPTWQLPMRRITISTWLKNLIHEHVDAEIDLIPNGIDTQQFNAPPRSKQGRPTFGFLYSKNPEKGVDLMVKAIEQAKQQRPDIRIVGFGAQPPTPMPVVMQSDDFIWAPTDDQIAEIYRQCDAWLFGTHREGFGLPILEAMACRTPVIATPAAAAPDLVNPDCGRLLSDFEPQSMADAIINLCDMNTTTWQRLSQNAREVALQHDWGQATDRLEAVLQDAVALNHSATEQKGITPS